MLAPSAWLAVEPDGKQKLPVVTAPDQNNLFSPIPATKRREDRIPARNTFFSATSRRSPRKAIRARFDLRSGQDGAEPLPELSSCC